MALPTEKEKTPHTKKYRPSFLPYILAILSLNFLDLWSIGMKHWIKTTLGIGLAIGLWQVSADARFLDYKNQKNIPTTPAPIPQTKITPTTNSYSSEVAPKGISLRFENLSLISVLQNIQEETGILFSIDSSMETVPS